MFGIGIWGFIEKEESTKGKDERKQKTSRHAWLAWQDALCISVSSLVGVVRLKLVLVDVMSERTTVVEVYGILEGSLWQWCQLLCLSRCRVGSW